MKTNYSFQKSASRMLILTGVLSMIIGLFTLVYPPSIDDSLWGYPFHFVPHVAVSILLVIAHMLKAYGFVGLSRFDGTSKLTRWSLIVAALGFTFVAVCEAISATFFGAPIDSHEAINLNNGYGIGSMLFAIPSMIAGVGIIRKRVLFGFSRWSVFFSGAFMIFLVTPALFMGRSWPAYLALTVWSLFYLWIGVAMNQTLKSKNA